MKTPDHGWWLLYRTDDLDPWQLYSRCRSQREARETADLARALSGRWRFAVVRVDYRDERIGVPCDTATLRRWGGRVIRPADKPA